MTMKSTNKNYLLIAAVSTALLSSTTTLAAETDGVVIGTDHPQTISVTAPASTFEQGSGTTSTTAWEITSNNAVGVSFSGTSPSATTAGAQAYPQFYKREVDADGTLITGKYDHLTTVFGAVVSGLQSIANQTGTTDGSTTEAERTWGGGATPAGTPANLVEGLVAGSTGSGPDAQWGSIMPADDGTFTLTLTSKGTGDVATTQSGDYKIAVTVTITGEEKGDVAAGESTGD